MRRGSRMKKTKSESDLRKELREIIEEEKRAKEIDATFQLYLMKYSNRDNDEKFRAFVYFLLLNSFFFRASKVQQSLMLREERFQLNIRRELAKAIEEEKMEKAFQMELVDQYIEYPQIVENIVEDPVEVSIVIDPVEVSLVEDPVEVSLVEVKDINIPENIDSIRPFFVRRSRRNYKRPSKYLF